jgi:hypothetical protein
MKKYTIPARQMKKTMMANSAHGKVFFGVVTVPVSCSKGSLGGICGFAAMF